MSTKNNPGAFRCYEAALPDEHIFTILARDPAGPATLRFWAQERQRVGKTKNPDDLDRIADAMRDARLMEEWREGNLDPMGDGSGPSWKLCKITDDEGGPVRIDKDQTVYVPAERDGDEAVRLNVEWLQARTRDLVEGRIDREFFAELIDLACSSPQRQAAVGDETSPETPVVEQDFPNVQPYRAGKAPSWPAARIDDLHTRTTLLHEEDRERMKEVIRALGFSRLGDVLTSRDPAILSRYEEMLALAEDMTRARNGETPAAKRLLATFADKEDAKIFFDAKVTSLREADPPVGESEADLYEKVAHGLGIDPEQLRADYERPLGKAPELGMGYGKGSSRDVTEIDTPEMPPHRFAMFDKSKGWAYGRGLEISPAHIPAMLDRMEEDGYTLVAALGSQADKVGMIFRRKEMVTLDWSIHDFTPVARPKMPEPPDFDPDGLLLRDDDPPVAEPDLDRGRGQEP